MLMTTVVQNNGGLFPKLTDQELVSRSIAGDVGAFRELTARYYPLIRTLACSATGRAKQSEVLARKTFAVARKQLSALPEQFQLRPWLCSIACHVIDAALAEQFVRHYSFENKTTEAQSGPRLCLSQS